MRETRIKTTIISHPNQWLFSKITNTGEDVEKGKLLQYFQQEYKLVQPLCKTVCSFLKKLKIELHMIQEFHTGQISKEMKSINQRDSCSLPFTAVLFTIAKIKKHPKFPSMDEWMCMLFSHQMSEKAYHLQQHGCT